ncbi:PKD domain-containing protein [Halorussus lipolyticus]|uniref:PKD domain-containing protein n=1 Tax=Halorussus lipolyticus TaxID=3034024 RepID=UPI0023E7B33A|nr:PKD domain-containing protein [Halorussus sp. DT80]
MKRAILVGVLTLLVAGAPVVGTVGAVSAPSDAGNTSSPPDRWAKTVGGNDDDKLATGVRVDDGYLVVGWSKSLTDGDAHDGYVAMLDRAGETKWEKSYGGSGEDKIFDIETVEDGYLVVGVTTEGGTEDGWLMKLGPEGQKQWERTYGSSGPEEFWSVARSGGNIYVGGWEKEDGHTQAWAMKLTDKGKAVWSETYSTLRSGSDEYVNSIFVTGNGDLLLTGTTQGSSTDPSDGWVLRVDGQGEVEWDRTYGGHEFDKVHDAVAASDGGYVLAGRTASKGNGEQDGWMLKIGGDGETKWERTYGTRKDDAFYGIHNDPDGGYVVSGTKHVLGEVGADGWVLKTDSKGKRGWAETFGGEYWDKFWPVIEGHGGGYLAIGESTSYSESRDGWVVRIGGPAVSAIEDADANESGTTVTLDDSPVRAITLSDSNVSGVVSVAEEPNVSALSPPGDALYAVTMDGPSALANGSANVEFTVQTGVVETNLSDVKVAQQTAEGWTMLKTTVVSEENGTAVLAVETEGTGTLVVTDVPAPSASIDADESVLVGETIELSASGSSAAGNATLAGYEWSVGTESFSGQTASAGFDSVGNRTVELTVTDQNGLQDTATATLVVNDRPEVSVSAPDSATVGKATSLSADVTDEVGDVTVTWRFASGKVTGESVEHSFGSPGTQTVTVVVEDEYGATVTKDVQVQVQAQGSDAGQATETTTADSGGEVPGFGVGAALVALLGAVVVAARLRG